MEFRHKAYRAPDYLPPRFHPNTVWYWATVATFIGGTVAAALGA